MQTTSATIQTFMFKFLMAIVLAVAILAMVQEHQRHFKPLPTGPMPAVVVP